MVRAPEAGTGQGEYVDGPRACFGGGAGLRAGPAHLRQEVAETVMLMPDGSVKNRLLWQTIIADWIGYGWNPRNIKGMLEAYRAGGIKLKKNGNGSSTAVPYEYPQEDDWKPGQKFNFTKNAVKT